MKYKSPKAIMFDLDGTLLDTAPDFTEALNQLLKEENKEPVASTKIRQAVSNGSKALIALGFNIPEDHLKFDQYRQRLLDLYTENIAQYTQLFPGMQEVLNKISHCNIPWGIATNKPELYTNHLLKQLNIKPECALVICPDHVNKPKPHPESLIKAAEAFSCSTDEIVYIGDHIRDIECGKNANATTIACGYGYINENENIFDWHADHVVQHATEIWPIIEQALQKPQGHQE